MFINLEKLLEVYFASIQKLQLTLHGGFTFLVMGLNVVVVAAAAVVVSGVGSNTILQVSSTAEPSTSGRSKSGREETG